MPPCSQFWPQIKPFFTANNWKHFLKQSHKFRQRLWCTEMFLLKRLGEGKWGLQHVYGPHPCDFASGIYFTVVRSLFSSLTARNTMKSFPRTTLSQEYCQGNQEAWQYGILTPCVGRTQFKDTHYIDPCTSPWLYLTKCNVNWSAH